MIVWFYLRMFKTVFCNYDFLEVCRVESILIRLFIHYMGSAYF